MDVRSQAGQGRAGQVRKCPGAALSMNVMMGHDMSGRLAGVSELCEVMWDGT